MSAPEPPTLDEAFMTALDMAKRFGELAAGYRANLEALGYSPTAAEQASLHLLMLMQAKAFEEPK